MVRPIESEDRIGRIILPQTTRERDFVRNQHEVIAVGGWEICEDEDCSRYHALDGDAFHLTDQRIQPGAWVLVEQASLIEAEPESRTYYVKIADIAAVFLEGE